MQVLGKGRKNAPPSSERVSHLTKSFPDWDFSGSGTVRFNALQQAFIDLQHSRIAMQDRAVADVVDHFLNVSDTEELVIYRPNELDRRRFIRLMLVLTESMEDESFYFFFRQLHPTLTYLRRLTTGTPISELTWQLFQKLDVNCSGYVSHYILKDIFAEKDWLVQLLLAHIPKAESITKRLTYPQFHHYVKEILTELTEDKRATVASDTLSKTIQTIDAKGNPLHRVLLCPLTIQQEQRRDAFYLFRLPETEDVAGPVTKAQSHGGTFQPAPPPRPPTDTNNSRRPTAQYMRSTGVEETTTEETTKGMEMATFLTYEERERLAIEADEILQRESLRHQANRTTEMLRRRQEEENSAWRTSVLDELNSLRAELEKLEDDEEAEFEFAKEKEQRKRDALAENERTRNEVMKYHSSLHRQIRSYSEKLADEEKELELELQMKETIAQKMQERKLQAQKEKKKKWQDYRHKELQQKRKQEEEEEELKNRRPSNKKYLKEIAEWTNAEIVDWLQDIGIRNRLVHKLFREKQITGLEFSVVHYCDLLQLIGDDLKDYREWIWTDLVRIRSKWEQNLKEKKNQMNFWAAVRTSNLEQLRHCTNQGADIDMFLDEQGLAPLHYACLRKDLEMAKLLLELGAHVEVKACPSNETPLHISCRDTVQHLEAVELLLSKGADGLAVVAASPNNPSQVGYNAVQLAVKVHNDDIIDMLLQFEGPYNWAKQNLDAKSVLELTSNLSTLILLSQTLGIPRAQLLRAPASKPVMLDPVLQTAFVAPVPVSPYLTQD
eukprot:TRINITY_DN63456_c0_g1_i1.p1 TRINITY_DN63456_c0_g1~~TRINITY_DN63456_c0_g1_i1.p1  ORF type:complete len:780 (-),score=84.61 TRINITY_DN63456_c0_g1_i1:1517-3856(-)